MLDCIIATYSGIPGLDPDDRLLLEALRARGLTVETGVWTDASVDWSATRLCLLRSTWDYPKHFERFCRWLELVDAVTVVRNRADVVRWNSHKGYLRELAAAGIPTVPTVWLERGARADLAAVLAERGWPEAVVKPALGAAGLDVLAVSSDALQSAQSHVDRLLRDRDVLVQPYLHAAAGQLERSLVFIAGAFSHAVSKTPFDTKLAIGDATTRVVAPSLAEQTVASQAIAVVPGGAPLYARVDLFRRPGGGVLINEVELIEPALYLGAHPTAAGVLADAIAREL